MGWSWLILEGESEVVEFQTSRPRGSGWGVSEVIGIAGVAGRTDGLRQEGERRVGFGVAPRRGPLVAEERDPDHHRGRVAAASVRGIGRTMAPPVTRVAVIRACHDRGGGQWGWGEGFGMDEGALTVSVSNGDSDGSRRVAVGWACAHLRAFARKGKAEP